MTRQEVIDAIFKGDPPVKYGLQEFQVVAKPTNKTDEFVKFKAPAFYMTYK